MTILLGDQVSPADEVVRRELFLQLAPVNIRMCLAASNTADLSKLAALVDAVMEVATPTFTALESPPVQM